MYFDNMAIYAGAHNAFAVISIDWCKRRRGGSPLIPRRRSSRRERSPHSLPEVVRTVLRANRAGAQITFQLPNQSLDP